MMESDLSVWVLGFLNPVALLMALIFTVSLIKRRFGVGSYTDFAIGGIFSFALIASMSDPISLGDAGIFDMRFLFIGTCTALISPRAGMVTLVTGVVYRISIGGGGVVPGVVGMIVAYAGALVWHRWLARRDMHFAAHAMSLALLVSLHAFSILLAPQEFWLTLAMTLAPSMVLVNVVGVFLIKSLLSHELNFISDAEDHRQLAARDHLTGLLNRHSLEEGYANIKLGKATLDGVSTIYFDIDNFKSINDVNGHQFGDAALKSIGERLTAVLRPGDLFCRVGGDEFVIVLAGVQEQEAKIIAERCRLKIEADEISFGGRSVAMTISVGAIWTRSLVDMEKGLGHADKALYEAKNEGRNVVVFRSLSERDPEPPLAQAS